MRPSGTPADPAARAARLLRWYPRAWRARYGDEFAELLIADIAERPRSAARTLDIARGGTVARLVGAGLCGFGDRRIAASLAMFGCSLAVFLGIGAAMWSQLTIGWQWSRSASTPATVATVTTSAAMLAFLVLGALAALPVLAVVPARIARCQGKGLIGPSTVFVAASTILFVGGRHFGNGWPGTGGHRGLVPGGLAAFEWATSLSVSSYWAHPAALAAFPAAELAWMAVSPVAAACAATAAAKLVRRAELPPRALAIETRLAAVACVVMAVFLAGSCCWIATGGGQPSLFHAGLIDVAGAGVLAVALAVARQAARTAGLRIMEH